MSDYPEHDKLSEISDESQIVGEFLDVFLPSKGIVLAEYNSNDYLHPTNRTIRSLLAEFFGIDQAKIDAEKKSMLEALRG